MKPYIVCGMLHYNEEFFSKHCVGALYDSVDEFVIVDSLSSDRSLENIKLLDKDKKITVISRKWNNNYSDARNTYLDHIKKNIWPKHKTNLYYLRVDLDEIYFKEWLDNAISFIDENPDVEGIRSNFYSFTQDLNHLDEKNPTESRVSLFRYSPDIEYRNKLHEMPVHKNTGVPLYASPFDDKRLGVHYSPGFAYLHYSWTDPVRCFQKAVNYTKTYVEQGTETKEHLETIEPNKQSWWWNKVSSIKYTGKLPDVFSKLGLLEGQENPDIIENAKPKISVYTFVKNGIKFDYPFIEAINSILPIAEEVILNLGDSEDGTTGLAHKAFDGIEKVKIFERKWAGKDKGTLFLREESNWAKSQCKNEICLYLQSDEIYHEDDLEKILETAKILSERQDLLGASFSWRHFDGDYGTVNPYSYPREVRLIKKNELESIGDAQSMGMIKNNLINVAAFPELLLQSDIRVFHIGWVREPKKMLSKLVDFDSYYHTESEVKEMHKNDTKRHIDGNYNYGDRNSHIKWEETLPAILYPRVLRYEKEFSRIIKNKAKF